VGGEEIEEKIPLPTAYKSSCHFFPRWKTIDLLYHFFDFVL
jgi:hypothetical protein